MEKSKLNPELPIILVDTSYWLYYRFFALRNWYSRAFPDLVASKPNFNLEHNWLEDEIFCNKYKKLFIDNIKSICKQYKTVLTNVVFCIDCPHKDIWRLEKYKDYKGTRLDSHRKNEFNAYNLFTYIKKIYIPQLQLLYGVKYIYNNKCEADDIIGVFAPFLISNGFCNGNGNGNVNSVYILANDNDYLQICNDNIKMITGLLSKRDGSVLKSEKCLGEKYLIKKILIGDSSDNIKCCSANYSFLETGIIDDALQTNKLCIYKNIYKHIANNIIDSDIAIGNATDNATDNATGDSTKYNILKDRLYKIRSGIIKSSDDKEINFIKNFYENTILMDFQMIPKKLKNELLHKFMNYLA